MSEFATADELLAECGAVRYAEREIMGRKFLLGSITAAEYAEIASLAGDKSNPQKAATGLLNMYSRLIYHVYKADKSGKRLFTMQQTQELKRLDSGLFTAMAEAAEEHIDSKSLSLEDAAKNSDATASDSSPTD